MADDGNPAAAAAAQQLTDEQMRILVQLNSLNPNLLPLHALQALLMQPQQPQLQFSSGLSATPNNLTASTSQYDSANLPSTSSNMTRNSNNQMLAGQGGTQSARLVQQLLSQATSSGGADGKKATQVPNQCKHNREHCNKMWAEQLQLRADAAVDDSVRTAVGLGCALRMLTTVYAVEVEQELNGLRIRAPTEVTDAEHAVATQVVKEVLEVHRNLPSEETSTNFANGLIRFNKFKTTVDKSAVNRIKAMLKRTKWCIPFSDLVAVVKPTHSITADRPARQANEQSMASPCEDCKSDIGTYKKLNKIKDERIALEALGTSTANVGLRDATLMLIVAIANRKTGVAIDRRGEDRALDQEEINHAMTTANLLLSCSKIPGGTIAAKFWESLMKDPRFVPVEIAMTPSIAHIFNETLSPVDVQVNMELEEYRQSVEKVLQENVLQLRKNCEKNIKFLEKERDAKMAQKLKELLQWREQQLSHGPATLAAAAAAAPTTPETPQNETLRTVHSGERKRGHPKTDNSDDDNMNDIP